MTRAVKPKSLSKGDTIAIVSPASIIKPEYVAGACKRLTECGFNVKIMPHALDRYGSMAGRLTDRLSDLKEALTDDEISAVLCSRGGYGCVQLLDELAKLPLGDNPKWLIGFSDVSALHGLMASRGIVSIHGSMTKALAEKGIDDEANSRLLDLLGGRIKPLKWTSNEGNIAGRATGKLLGGNLAVIQGLINTEFSQFKDGAILFLEDIGEPIYKINRIFYQLKLSGVLDRIAGLVIGQFTDYKADANHNTMEQMLMELFESWHIEIPTAFNAPIGHVDYNQPVLHNAPVTLTVTPTTAEIAYN